MPGSGTVTAYLAATITQIQQNPFPLPGPPQGHPSFNPNYVPSIGYATSVYSVALAAVTGGIDNVNTFELFRTVLASGQVALSVVNTAGQVRAGPRRAWPSASLASGGALVPSQAQAMLYPAASGLTHTLPPASGAGGLIYGFFNPTAGNETIAMAGTDRIVGLGGIPLASAPLPPSGMVVLYGDPSQGAANGAWRAMFANPAAMASNLAHGECYLAYSGATQLLLVPYNGCNILCGGAQFQLPASGVAVANTGLTGNTLYYVYYNDGALVLSTTGYVTDTTPGNIGVKVMSGNSAYTLVGMAYTSNNTPGQFQPQGVGTASWFNRKGIALSVSGIATTTTSTVPAELASPSYRAPFVCWGDTTTRINADCNAANSASGNSTEILVGLDGAVPANVGGGQMYSNPPGAFGYTGSKYTAVLSEGAHTAAPFGAVGNPSTGSFANGLLSVEVQA